MFVGIIEKGSENIQLMSISENHRTFSFHGVSVLVESPDYKLLAAVQHDFSFFAANIPKPDLRIECRLEKPDYDRLPGLTSSLATPRNICFMGNGLVYIDYFGRALNIYNAKEGSCEIFTDDFHVALEIIYLTILSRVSDMLEQRGIHRVHALGLEHAGRGVVLMLPSGGGKSTLALSVLMNPNNGIRLISEDSPLIRRDGWLLPFPVRIGVHPDKVPEGIDPTFKLFQNRMEFDPKVTIDVSFFSDRLVRDAVRPGIILLGRRTTLKDAQINAVPRRRVIRHALMNSVIGVGLYQGMEFIFQQGFRDVISHGFKAVSRSRNNMRLARLSGIYEFIIGRDTKHNFETLTDFLEKTQ
jgi:hypothetical protein